MNKVLTLLLLVIGSITASAQTQVENVLRDAAKYNAAYLDKDFETLIKEYTIPSVVEKGGGSELMTKVAIEESKTLINSGMFVEEITPGKPGKIMIAGDHLHTILPQDVKMTVGKQILIKKAHYLASSSDDGLTWTFLDLEAYDATSIKEYVPAFTGELEIPTVEFVDPERK